MTWKHVVMGSVALICVTVVIWILAIHKINGALHSGSMALMGAIVVAAFGVGPPVVKRLFRKEKSDARSERDP